MKTKIMYLIVFAFASVFAQAENSLVFDGTGTSYVDCGNSAAFSTTVLTVEARIKLAEGNNNANKTFIATEGWADNTNQGYSLRFTSEGQLEWALGLGGSWGSVVDTIAFPQGEWVTVSAVLDNTSAKLYVNGELRQDATLAAALAPSSQNLIIGDGAMWKGRGFSGNTSDVRIWSIARTTAEVMADYNTNLDGTESGLVANWQMDEGKNLILEDKVGTYEAILQAGVVWQTGAPEDDNAEALVFDGTGTSYVDCGNSAAFSTTVLTVEARIKLAEGNNNANKTFIATEGWADNTNQGYSLRFTSEGQLEWALGLGGSWGSVVDTIAFPQGEWVTVSVVLDSTSAKLYINGELRQDATLAAALAPSSQNLIIGDGAMWKGRGFSGMASDVRIWSVARSAAEVMADDNTNLAGTESGLVANWQMDEGEGVTLIDKVGTYGATLQAGVVWYAEVVDTDNTQSLIFDGTGTSYVDCGNNVAYSTTVLSIEAKIKLPQGNNNANKTFIASEGAVDGTNQGYSLRFNNDGKLEWALGLGASWGSVVDSIAFPQGEWVTVSAVLDNTSAKLYINGELRQDATLAAELAPSSQNLIIGDGAMWKGRGFSGNVSDVRVWSTARTSTEVMANYNIELEGTEVGLVANWQMEEGNGTTLADKAGNYEATLQDGVSWATPTTGIDNQKVSLNNFKVISSLGTVALINNETANASASIYAISGKQVCAVLVDSRSFVTVSDMPSGIYIVRFVTSDNVSYSEKFVVR